MATTASATEELSKVSPEPNLAANTSTASDKKRLSSFLLKTPALLQHFIWPGTQLILKFFIRFEVRGLEAVEKLPRGVIFAPNHSSELDCILVPAALHFTSKHLGMFYTSRESSFYKNSSWRKIFYGGLFFKIWGAYPVVIGTHNYDLSLQNHIELLKRGHPVCIFPEGKKTITGNVGIPKGGVGYLSYMTGSPIVPIAIENLYKLTLMDFLLRRKKVILTFGKPLYPRDLFTDPQHIVISHEHDDCRLAAAKVMSSVEKLLKV